MASNEITVIVPTRNAERFIGRALANVRLQSHAPKETIVVDDGSSDATREIARAMGARVIAGPRAGVAAARNLGIENATTEWLAFIDADDCWHPQRLELALAAAKSDASVEMIANDWDTVDHDGKTLLANCVTALRQYAHYAVRLAEPGLARLEGADFAASLAEWCIFLPGSVIIRKNVFERGGMYDRTLSYSSDTEFFLRMAATARSVLFLERSLLAYVQHPEQMTRANRHARSRIEVATRIMSRPQIYHPATVAATSARLPILHLRRAFADASGRRFVSAIRHLVLARHGATNRQTWNLAFIRAIAKIPPLRTIFSIDPGVRAKLASTPGRANRARAGDPFVEWASIIGASQTLFADTTATSFARPDLRASTSPAVSLPPLDQRPRDFVFRSTPRARRYRRAFDLVVGAAALVALSPALLAAAVAILLEDGRPIFFVQRRVGRAGKTFAIFKLRTMRRETSGDRLSPRDARDSRITRVGRILRKTSVDEIPQLFNVILGDMSLVGPRPEMQFLVNRYERWQHLRHLNAPGVTGLWQVTARKTLPLEDPRATLIDLDYLHRRSPSLDIALILKTFLAVARPKGAY